MTPPAAGPAARSAAPPLRRPISPRRVSGPARRATRARPQPAGAPSLLLRLVDHPLLDRLIRGRIWIALIAFALMSVVAMQVTLLKLNTGIATQIQRARTLSRENALLGVQVSALEASERIQTLAGHNGMVPAPAGEVRYLGVGSGDASRAAASITAPRTRAKALAAAAPTTGAASSPSAAAASSPGTASSPSAAAPPPSTSAASGSGAAAPAPTGGPTSATTTVGRP